MIKLYEKLKIDKIKLILLLILIIISFILSYYFQIILKTNIIFTHFFYVPIILACLWWKFKGLIVPIFLSALLIIFSLSVGVDNTELELLNNFLRALLLTGIGIVVAILSSNISITSDKLKARVKELNCLYGIIKTISNPNNSLEDILTSVIERIRSAWQYPRLTCAKILFDDKEYISDNFKATPWKISKEVHINDRILKLDVHCLEECTFQQEEINLLNEILEQLRGILILKLAWIS